MTISPSPKKIIYDFGSYNGNDIPYYLKKSDLVVAVEANPHLCKQIERSFLTEITNGRLILEKCVITSDDLKKEVPFYLHRELGSAGSQFPEPNKDRIHEFEQVLLPCRSVLSIVQQYGSPYYIKIDIEHYDAAILKALFMNGIYPPFISAESHDIQVFSLLVALGRYNAFKLVDGATLSKKYKNASIYTNNKKELYSFPNHSAGPFGEDIDGEWMTANNFFRLLAFENLGWKDIHATNQVPPNPKVVSRLENYVTLNVLRRKIKRLLLFRSDTE